jgi:hypothetical protein
MGRFIVALRALLVAAVDHARGQIDAAAGRVGHDNSDAPLILLRDYSGYCF